MGITYAGQAESAATGKKLAEGLSIANAKTQGALPPSHGSSFSASSRPSRPCLHPQSPYLLKLQMRTDLASKAAPWCSGEEKTSTCNEVAKKDHLLFPPYWKHHMVAHKLALIGKKKNILGKFLLLLLLAKTARCSTWFSVSSLKHSPPVLMPNANSPVVFVWTIITHHLLQ